MRRAATTPLGRPMYLVGVLLVLLVGCNDREADPPDTMPPPPGPVAEWFREVTAEAGIDFVLETGATGELLLPEIMGGGVALFDFDGDGDLDIYLVNGNLTPGDFAPATIPAPGPGNRLYRQERDGRFVDATAVSGLGDGGYGMGVAIGDIDNDGDADVYVTNYGPDRLYRNRGDGTFEDVTVAAGAGVDGWSCSAAFVDYDRDGFLDLYVTRYVEFDPQTRCPDFAGRPDYCSPKAFPPVHDVLLHNNGDGTFTDVSEEAAIASVAAAGLGVIGQDLNDDDWPDIFVANDGYPNHLWVNQRDGTFREVAVMMGAAYNIDGRPEAGMGVLAADLDGDGLLDLFLTHLRFQTNTLYRNLGGGSFVDVSGPSGLGSSSSLYTGFGTAAFDVEHDGDLDLVVVNGRVNFHGPHPDAALEPPWNALCEQNLFYVNRGDGRFELVEEPVASFRGRVEITRGLAVGDVDSDGDLDMIITNVRGPARLYRNELPHGGHWLIVRAVDPAITRDAIGARVTVLLGDRRLVRPITRSSGYLSSRDPRAHFGLAEVDGVDGVEIRWPDGMRERFSVAGVDRVVELTRGTGSPLR